MSRAPELVADLDVLEGHFAAELNLMTSLCPVHAVVDLNAVSWECREQVVADAEESGRLDLGDRRIGRIDRQTHAEVLHAGHAFRRIAARGELVVADAELVEQRRCHRPLPRADDILDALTR